ncbi:MAG: HEAT repeat domain-containing protein [Acidobacteriia bacterium]|nr:HEAT repeat domain-containing protein [Terriglobia bacterium]
MAGLLGRDLTSDEQAVEAGLLATLEEHKKSRDADTSFFETAASVPELLCPAAVSVLESDLEPALRRWLYLQLLERPECLRQLIAPGHFSREQLLAVSRHLMTIDGFFDVKLAGLLPRRHADQRRLDTQNMLRVLDVLDAISPGSRLVLAVNHLTHHPDQHIASKAALVVGRRLQSKQWVKGQMTSEDPRVRANVLEALWGIHSESAREAFRIGVNDENNRVVGNALVGLHPFGEPGLSEFVARMLEDPRPAFRWTAAWVMGRIGDPQFGEKLQRALQDKDPKVGKAAERALAAVQSACQAQPPTAEPISAPSPVAPPGEPTSAATP